MLLLLLLLRLLVFVDAVMMRYRSDEFQIRNATRSLRHPGGRESDTRLRIQKCIIRFFLRRSCVDSVLRGSFF
jgi:hypothetical protein